MSQLLNVKVLGSGKPLVVLHGLFGMLDNWQSLANEWQEQFKVILVDQRNHGRSFHTPTHRYPEMATDVVRVLDHLGIERVSVLGHSMGGKTAMQLAFDYPNRLDKLMVADIGPYAYPPGHDLIFKTLLSVNTSELNSRSEAEQQLSEFISDTGVRQFLLKSLYRLEQNGYAWRFNLPVLYEEYPHINGSLQGVSYMEDVLFLRGGLSGYVPDQRWPQVLEHFPNAQLITIEGAGHWLHADRPNAFSKEVTAFLGA